MANLYQRRKLFSLRREEPTDCDRAHYLTVSTGRMEPYLRALSVEPLFAYDDEGELLASRDNDDYFIHLYTTRLRLEADINQVLRIDKSTRTVGSYETPTIADVHHPQPTQPRTPARVLTKNIRPMTLIESAQLLQSTGQDYAGWRIDPHMATELTVEKHHLPTIRDLADGKPIEAAFTAIGFEELRHMPLTICDQERAAACDLPPDHILLKNRIELDGVAGRRWDVYYVATGTTDAYEFPALDAATQTHLADSLGQQAVIVDPGTPGWQRDLLWDMRTEAVPIV